MPGLAAASARRTTGPHPCETSPEYRKTTPSPPPGGGWTACPGPSSPARRPARATPCPSPPGAPATASQSRSPTLAAGWARPAGTRPQRRCRPLPRRRAQAPFCTGAAAWICRSRTGRTAPKTARGARSGNVVQRLTALLGIGEAEVLQSEQLVHTVRPPFSMLRKRWPDASDSPTGVKHSSRYTAKKLTVMAWGCAPVSMG